MRRAYIVAAIVLIGSSVKADQGWQDNQDGSNFACYDVSSYSANNLVSALTQYASALPSGQIVIGPQPVANWPVSSVRWYCVDGSRPDDSGVGYSDTSSADCGTKAKKTLAGLGVIFPRVCASHRPVVVIADGTYADGLDAFLEGVSGCAQNYPLIVATGTNATANATAFLGDAADRTFVGGITVTGLNAAGYTPVGTPTTGQIQFTKFGGGTPGLPAEPASPLGYRVRFDCATATAALRCFSQMIIGVPASDTVNLLTVNTTPLPATPSTSDRFYIEQPGVIVGGTNVSNAALTVPGPGSIATNALTSQIVGIYVNTSSRFSGGRYGFMFSGHAFFATLDATLIRTLITYKDETGTSRQVGSSLRADGISGCSGNIGIGSVSADETVIIAGPMSFTNATVFKLSNGTYANGIALFNCNPNVDDPGNQPQSEIGGRQPNAQPAVRVVGATLAGLRTAGLNLVDSSITLSRTAITSVGANPAIALQGRSAISVSDQLTGSSGNTDVGLDLASAKGSTVLIYSNPTLTGTAGDVRLADGTIATWTQAAGGLIDTAGNTLYGTSSFPVRVMPAGTFMSGGAVTVTNMGGSGTQCVHVNNAGTMSITGTGDCGTGSGGVSSVTGTAQRISATPTTGAVVVDTIGGFYSGAVSGGNEDLGTALTNGLVCNDTTAGVAVLRSCVSGTDFQPPTAKTCSSGQFLSEIDVTGATVCGTPAGGGSVTTVTGTPPIFITSTPTTTPNVTIQGSILDGTTGTSGQNLGALTNGTLQQTVSAGHSTISAFNGTSGSVPFYTSSGQLAQDNTNFVWDPTNHALDLHGGINTTVLPTIAGASLLVDVTAGHAAQVSWSQTGTIGGSIILNSNSTEFYMPTARFWSSATAQSGGAVNISAGNVAIHGAASGASGPATLGALQVDSQNTQTGIALARTNGRQDINKTTTGTGAVTLGLGTGDSNAMVLYTNSTTALTVTTAQQLNIPATVAPSTPAASTGTFYLDSTSKNFVLINDAGTANHGAQTKANTTGVALTALSDAGGWTTQTFQAPLVACTDYVSLTCVTGATDLGGTNPTPTVIGTEDAATVRGDLVVKQRATPSTPSGTDVVLWNGSTAGIESIDPAGTTRFMAKDVTCSGANVATSIGSGTLGCGPASVACAGLPALTGPDVVSSAGSCANKVKGVTDGANVDWPVSGTFTGNQAMITSGGNWTTTDECNVFASCSAGGALTGTYPNPGVNLSAGGSVTGTVACANQSAFGGDLSSAGGTCSVQVQAIEETSGPARLAINAIPDLGSGNASVLNRPGGTGTVVGTDSRALIVADELTYYVSYTLSVGGGYIATSNTTNLGTGTNIEYPTSHVALHATLCVNLIANGIITGNPIVNTTRNGSGIGGGSGVNFTSSTTPGVYCTGSFLTGSSSATDTYGVEQANSATGTMTYSAHLVLN